MFVWITRKVRIALYCLSPGLGIRQDEAREFKSLNVSHLPIRGRRGVGLKHVFDLMEVEFQNSYASRRLINCLRQSRESKFKFAHIATHGSIRIRKRTGLGVGGHLPGSAAGARFPEFDGHFKQTAIVSTACKSGVSVVKGVVTWNSGEFAITSGQNAVRVFRTQFCSRIFFITSCSTQSTARPQRSNRIPRTIKIHTGLSYSPAPTCKSGEKARSTPSFWGAAFASSVQLLSRTKV